MIKEQPSLPQKLLNAGFEVLEETVWPKYKYSPKDNWFGCSVYHPDHRFVKGEVTVDLSLQGLITGIYATGQDYKDYAPLWKKMAIRLVGVRQNGKILYKSLTGVMPDDEFVDSIITLAGLNTTSE